MPILSCDKSDKSDLSQEDRELAKVVHIIVREFRGNATAFFSQVQKIEGGVHPDGKSEAATVNQFIRNL